MRVYLIRHGETDLNRDLVFQGYEEVPLNARGIAQAARLAERLARGPLDHIYASDLRRTVMTACILAAATGAPITYHPLLRERDPGALTGKAYAEGEAFFSDRAFLPPGGESLDVFHARVRASVAELVALEKGRARHVAIVTHGMLCKAFHELFLADGEDVAHVLAIGNGSLTTLEHRDGVWRLVEPVDTAHLEDPALGHATGG